MMHNFSSPVTDLIILSALYFHVKSNQTLLILTIFNFIQATRKLGIIDVAVS